MYLMVLVVDGVSWCSDSAMGDDVGASMRAVGDDGVAAVGVDASASVDDNVGAARGDDVGPIVGKRWLRYGR